MEKALRKVLRLSAVIERTGKPKSSIYADMAKGSFPKPVPLGDKAVGWLEDEVDDWLAARIAERDGQPPVGKAA
jgi:prophage regulatory protein